MLMEGNISFCSPGKSPCQGCPFPSSEVEERGEDSRGRRLAPAGLSEQAELYSPSQGVSGVECKKKPHPPTPSPQSLPSPPLCLPTRVYPRKRCHSQADPSTGATRPAGRIPGSDSCLQLTGPCPPPRLLSWQQPL